MKRFILATILSIALSIGVVSTGAFAVDITKNCKSVNQQDCALLNENSLNKNASGGPSAVKNGLNMAFFILGMLSVVMLIIGGFKFVASNGDSSIINSAKNTILYAIVGLAVALLAYAIVNFVINRI